MKWRAHIIMDLDLDKAVESGQIEPPTPEEWAEQIERCDSPEFAQDIKAGLGTLEGPDVVFTVVSTERVD